MSIENIQELMAAHPLWPEYEETLKITRETRTYGDASDREVNIKLDLLEDRVSELTNQISIDLGIADERRDNPLWQKWDAAWKELRRSKNEGRYEEEETIWEELKEIGKNIELQANRLSTDI